MGQSVGAFLKPLDPTAYQHVDNGGSAAAGELARAYNETGVQLPSASCKFGAFVQAIVTGAGAYIYIKISSTKTAPTSATDYSVRLADGDTAILPVNEQDKIFAWTDDATATTMLAVTRYD